MCNVINEKRKCCFVYSMCEYYLSLSYSCSCVASAPHPLVPLCVLCAVHKLSKFERQAQNERVEKILQKYKRREFRRQQKGALRSFYLYEMKDKYDDHEGYGEWISDCTHPDYDSWLNGSPSFVRGTGLKSDADQIRPPEDISEWIYEDPRSYIKDMDEWVFDTPTKHCK